MIDISGKRFGHLVAIKPIGQDHGGNWWWQCQCDCGAIHDGKFTSLNRGKTKSCGCSKKKTLSAIKHGMSKSATYSTWMRMKVRCTNSSAPNYGNYGGRGISVCDRWMDFKNFLADMGERPPGTTLDRIDNDGNYTPENCRWADDVTQHRNTRANVNLTYKGKTQCLAAWADELGIRRNTLQKRIAKGWSIQSALQRL